ncbi:MAG: tail fiber domain-containing protein [Bacteroidales bacterium]
MKKHLIFTVELAVVLAMLAGSFALLAQVPQGFKYQAVARDATGAVMANQELNFEISILKGDPSGEVVFEEQHTDTTNPFGLMTLDIGSGNIITGDFSSIAWGDDTYFLMVEVDGISMGTTQLLSVPYALHAQTVSVDKVDDADADPLNEIQSLSLSGNDLSLSDGGGSVTLPASAGGGDNWGSQTVVSDATLSGAGTTSDPLGVVQGEIMPDWEDIQGMPADFSDNTDDVDDADHDASNEIQTLSLSGTLLTLSKEGGTVTLPSSGGGDNWGTQTVVTDETLVGQGIETNPLGIVDGGVTSAKILDGSILTHDLANYNVTADKLANNSVATEKINAGAVTGIKIAQAGATNGQVLKWNGSSWVPGDVSDGGTSLWQENGSNIYYNTGNVGIGTSIPSALLHTSGTGTGQGNVLFEGEFKNSNPGDPPASGGGARMMWYPDKAAFRAGGVNSNEWDKNKIGTNSVAMGHGTTASGDFSTALGASTATGLTSTAMGGSTLASGSCSTSMGLSTNASGNNSTAMGMNTVASGRASTAMGSYTTAPSAYETVIGVFNTTYTPFDSVTWNANDRVFVIGNGEAGGTYKSNAMTVLKNGNVGIGPDNPVYKLDLLGEFNIQSEDPGDKAIFVNSTEALWYDGTYFSWGYGADYNYFARDVTIGTNADPGTHLLVVNGTAAKPGGGTWATWSDLRLKEIHENYAKGLKEIAALSPVTFSYKEDNLLMLPDDQEYVGLVAQDVQEIFPVAVSEGKDGYLQLDLHPVNIALINAVRELKRQNDELRKRIEALENN